MEIGSERVLPLNLHSCSADLGRNQGACFHNVTACCPLVVKMMNGLLIASPGQSCTLLRRNTPTEAE